jgi:hypothetical protein
MSHFRNYRDLRLPVAMWVFAAMLIVTFFGMVVTSTPVVLRPTLDPNVPAASVKP